MIFLYIYLIGVMIHACGLFIHEYEERKLFGWAKEWWYYRLVIFESVLWPLKIALLLMALFGFIGSLFKK